LASHSGTPACHRPTACPPPRGTRRVARAALLLAWVIILHAGTANAAGFHRGGVGSCAQCHVMHDAVAGQVAMDGTRPLLMAASATDVCLMCHGPNGVFGLDPRNPPRELGGGNFVFLLEDNLNDDANGAAQPIAGEAAGHSIISLTLGTITDSRWDRAPGGTFPSHSLGCTSCHDPHGNASFRMLRGPGPVASGQTQFFFPAPVAVGLDITDSAARESAMQHTAYLAGVSAWCANCHGIYHQDSGDALFPHVVEGILETSTQRRYNRYNGDADPMGGDFATAYLPEVPFEGTANTTTSMTGAAATDGIHCLTCHRAHASSAPAAGRWDFRVYRLAEDGVASGSYPLPNPYADAGQGQLCRKCHMQSGEHDRGMACLACHGVTPELPWPMEQP
jgi:hypothetical protein